MNLITAYFNQILAVGYFPDDSKPIIAIPFPHIPQLASIEKILVIVVFALLLVPILKKQKDFIQESRRVRILKIVSLLGSVLLLIHFYRISTGRF